MHLSENAPEVVAEPIRAARLLPLSVPNDALSSEEALLDLRRIRMALDAHPMVKDTSRKQRGQRWADAFLDGLERSSINAAGLLDWLAEHSATWGQEPETSPTNRAIAHLARHKCPGATPSDRECAAYHALFVLGDHAERDQQDPDRALALLMLRQRQPIESALSVMTGALKANPTSAHRRRWRAGTAPRQRSENLRKIASEAIKVLSHARRLINLGAAVYPDVVEAFRPGPKGRPELTVAWESLLIGGFSKAQARAMVRDTRGQRDARKRMHSRLSRKRKGSSQAGR